MKNVGIIDGLSHLETRLKQLQLQTQERSSNMQVHKMIKRPVVVHEEVQPVVQLGLQPPVPLKASGAILVARVETFLLLVQTSSEGGGTLSLHRFSLIMPCFSEPHASSRGGQKIQVVGTHRGWSRLFERFASRVRQHGVNKRGWQRRIDSPEVCAKFGANEGQGHWTSKEPKRRRNAREVHAETCASLSLRTVMLWYVAIMQRTNPDATRIS